MSTMERIAGDLPAGARVVHGDVTWTKLDDNYWDDGVNRPINNRAIDNRLANGGGILIDVIDVETEEVSAFDLEPGDYVVVTRGWPDADERFEENRDQQLWRVVGWTWHGATNSTILLDAPEDLMVETSREMTQGEAADCEPVQIYVVEAETFRLVVPGQDHDTWDWDWDDDYEFVGQPR